MNSSNVRPPAPACAGFVFCLLASSPVLAQQDSLPAALPRVEITGSAARAAGVATSALRSEIPVEKTPQSVIVLTRQLLDEQDAQTLPQALTNVSAVRTVDTRDLINGGFKIRGFAAGILVDGVALPGYFSTPESLAGVQRIEVVKGPAGTLFGGAQLSGSGGFFGGLIGVTTVAPESGPAYGAALRLGTSGHRGLSFDLNQPLGPEFGVRFAGEAGRRDSETDLVTAKHTTLQPSFAWRPTPDTELLVRLRHGENKGRDDSGQPVAGTLQPAPYSVPRERILTADGLPDSTAETDSVNLQWHQRIDAMWSWSLTVSKVSAEVDQRGVFPFPFPAGAGPLYALAGARLWEQFESTVVSPSVTARLRAAGALHTVVAGLDADYTRDDAFLHFSPGGGLLGFFDITNPVYPAWSEPVAPAIPDQQNRYRSTAFYLQDHADFGALQLTAGLRQTRAKVIDVNTDPFTNVDNNSTNDRTLFRGGVVYAFTPKVSAFAGWGQGMRLPTYAVFTNPVKPELSAQTELGLRLADAGGVSATLAWFDLSVRNAVVADPANPLQRIQVGRQRSRGVDVDLTWQATPEWRWLASLSRQNPRIEDTGKQVFNVPRTSLRVTTRYDFGVDSALPGLGAGLGLTRHGSRPIDAVNSLYTPAAVVLDAQLSYRVAAATLGVSVDNLLDKKYYTPSLYFGGGQVLPAPRRTVAASARFDF